MATQGKSQRASLTPVASALGDESFHGRSDPGPVKRLFLDLSDALAGDAHPDAHCLTRPAPTIDQTIAQLDHSSLSVGEGVERFIPWGLSHRIPSTPAVSSAAPTDATKVYQNPLRRAVHPNPGR